MLKSLRAVTTFPGVRDGHLMDTQIQWLYFPGPSGVANLLTHGLQIVAQTGCCRDARTPRSQAHLIRLFSTMYFERDLPPAKEEHVCPQTDVSLAVYRMWNPCSVFPFRVCDACTSSCLLAYE